MIKCNLKTIDDYALARMKRIFHATANYVVTSEYESIQNEGAKDDGGHETKKI